MEIKTDLTDLQLNCATYIFCAVNGSGSDVKTSLICAASHLQFPAKHKTFDVAQARRWLAVNHPAEECRHLAELLHDYALYVAGGK